jgi:hypothetical protein
LHCDRRIVVPGCASPTIGDPEAEQVIDFLGIGAQKAGTTWIFERLKEIPQIHFPAGKEVHFWDTYPHNGKNLSWWLELFPLDHFGRKQGEITPAYALLDQPKLQQIKRLLPDLCFFIQSVIRSLVPGHRL